MDPALGGAELERLLAVLLRMLNPAAVPPGSRPGGNDHADGGLGVDRFDIDTGDHVANVEQSGNCAGD